MVCTKALFVCCSLLGRGRCVGPNRCECDGYWKGQSCDTPSCPTGQNGLIECNGNGLCVGPGVCKCSKNYFGSSCEERGTTFFLRFCNRSTDVCACVLVMLKMSSTPQDVASTLSERTGDRVIDVGTDVDDLVTGQSVVLSCYVESSPPASIQFLKDEVVVEHRKLVTHFHRLAL